MSTKPTALGGRQPLLTGSALGLSTSQNFVLLGYVDSTTNSSLAVPNNCTALIGYWGGGMAGTVGNPGGDGADACYSVLQVAAGWTISWTIGAAGAQPAGLGGDTTVTLPGVLLRARGGGSASSNIGQYVSKGGAGGTNADGAPGADGGGAGGDDGAAGGGGGAAGLSSRLPGFPQGGAGGPGNGASPSGATPGGGGGSNNLAGTPGDGGTGRVLILLVRAA
jgi:hypothetical protein